MKTLLHVVALIFGAAIVIRGLAEGLPPWPFSANAWGGVMAFGFGVLLMLVGVLHVVRMAKGDEAWLEGKTTWLVIGLTVAITVGAVAVRSQPGPSRACVRMLAHVQELSRAGDPRAAAQFEAARPEILRRCEGMTAEERICAMAATTIDALRRCP